MAELFDAKDWNGAKDVAEEAIVAFGDVLQDEEAQKHVIGLPSFLRRFTPGAVIAYILTKGVEMYERRKEYKLAVNFLNVLLNQVTILQLSGP